MDTISDFMKLISLCTCFLLLHLQTGTCQPHACDTHPAPACTCWENYQRKSVSCNHIGLATVPGILTNQHTAIIETLEFAYNSIGTLHSNDLANVQARKVDLSHNALELVEHGAFSSMVDHLEWLDLSHNKLNDFLYYWPDDAALETLNLKNNHITDLEQLMTSLPLSLRHLKLAHNLLHPFDVSEDSVISNLKSLSLGPVPSLSFHHLIKKDNRQLNKLTIVDSSVDMGLISHQYLGKLRRLTELELVNCRLSPANSWMSSLTLQPIRSPLRLLSLPHNNLTVVPSTLAHLTKLYSLNLAHNKLETIFLNDFKHNRQLQYLYLQHNNLWHLASGAFSHLRQLRHLDLSYNNLEYLYPESFDASSLKFSNILVSHNPFKCDCQVTWMVEAIQKELSGKPGPFMPYEIHNDLKCNLPKEYSNVKLMYLASEPVYEDFLVDCQDKSKRLVDLKNSVGN